MKTIKMTLTVTYEPNGVSDDELVTMLRYIADHAAGDGMMTQDSDAEVEDWKVRVEVLD